MTQSEQIKKYLETQPLARERRNKNRAIGNILASKYGHESGGMYELKVDKVTMADLIADAINYDRQWRQCLEKNPELRGNDYDTKHDYETIHRKELGYAN